MEPGEALCLVEVPESVVREMSRHRMHPAQLDACVQAIAAALGAEHQELYLPVSIDRFSLHATPTRRLWAHSALRPSSPNESARAGDVWIYDEAGTLIASLEGLMLRPARSAAPSDCLFEMEWIPKHAGPTTMPAPTDIAAQLRAGVDELLLSHGLDRYKALRPLLDDASAAYVLAAFAQLGWTPRAGERFTTHQLLERMGVVQRQHALVGQMLRWLADDGILERDGDEWIAVRATAASVPRPGHMDGLRRDYLSVRHRACADGAVWRSARRCAERNERPAGGSVPERFDRDGRAIVYGVRRCGCVQCAGAGCRVARD